MLDKNHELEFDDIIKLFHDIRNTIICDNPIIKTKFLSRLAKKSTIPVFYLDFDLLYSGYIKAKILEKKQHITTFTPTRNDLLVILGNIIHRISITKCLVIIDSLNGFSNMISGNDSARLLNAYLMLIISVTKKNNSKVIISSVVKKREKAWVMVPINRQIITDQREKFHLGSNADMMYLEKISDQRVLQKFVFR